MRPLHCQRDRKIKILMGRSGSGNPVLKSGR